MIVKPVGGIANRMRVIESACNFSLIYSCKLTVIWERNETMNAKFSDCFNAIANVKVIELNYLGNSTASKVKRRLLNLAVLAYSKLYTSNKIYDHHIERNLLKHQFQIELIQKYLDRLANNNRGLYIETCWEFYTKADPSKLVIENTIQEAGNKIIKDRSAVIGVHVRRSDHEMAIQNSPLEAFVLQMQLAVNENKNIKFYLSTDSDEVISSLTNIYPDNIIVGISTRNRNSKEGIVSALIDLYCLSNCLKIWGSHGSSFSEKAAKMNNIPLKIISRALVSNVPTQ
jgi:hypothetical protein